MKKEAAARPEPRTLGPVSDLERHLPPDWWRRLFNAVYLKTDGDVLDREDNTIRETDVLVEAAGLDSSDRILDLCCGQGRHCLELARRGFEDVTGLDRSRYLIRLARRRARKAGLKVAFHEGDARKQRFNPNSFDCVVILGNSFGFFEQESDDVAVLESVKSVLRSEGTLVLDITDGAWMREHYEPRSWEWIDEQHFVCRERSLSKNGERLVSREVVVNAEIGVIADQFYAERLYTWQRITELLETVGFRDIMEHGTIQGSSDRGQDLGMMARRWLLTATAPAKAAAVADVPTARQVTVVLGDVSLPDTVKKDGVFNPEDFQTIQILKDALGELDGFSFEYFGDHSRFIKEMRHNPPPFVFNLCDEGYNNDAFKELHVPAYLEMLGIPYTGAGPACLGLCYNKSLVRSYAQMMDIPVPLETYFDPADLAATIPSALPALVKPNTGDSSIGITKDAVVHNSQDLIKYLETIRETLPGRAVLIQEFLTGPEYSVGLVGNPGLGFLQLPVLEVDYSGLDPSLPKILGYESKWIPDSPYWDTIKYREADISEDLRRRLYDYSILLFERLECRDYARIDFRADASGEVKLLEVNPNPGWCWDGKLNFMAGYAGMSYADLLGAILAAAARRLNIQE
jgi:D-alanine-D-alanine ligase